MCRIIVKVSGADTVDAPRYRSPSLIDTFLKSSVRASRLSSPRATLALAFLSLSVSHSSRLLSHCYTFNQRFRIYLVVTPAHLAASVSSTLTISFFHSLSFSLALSLAHALAHTHILPPYISLFPFCSVITLTLSLLYLK